MIRICFAAAIFSALTLPFSFAAGPAPEDNELSRFNFEIETMTLKALEEEFNVDSFAESIKFTVPVHPPLLPKDLVNARIEAEVGRRREKKFPPTEYDAIKQRAEEKYKMWKVGEQVAVRMRYADQDRVIEGPLRFVTVEKIQVGSLPIAKQDVSREDLTHLYWAEHERAISRYVRVKTRDFEEKREAYTEKQRKKISKVLWRRFGYTWKNKQWRPRSEVFSELYERARKTRFEQLYTKFQTEVYQANEYRFNEELGIWERPAPVVAEVKGNASSILEMFKTKVLEKKNEILDDGSGGGDEKLWEDDEDGAGEAAPDGEAPKQSAAPANDPPAAVAREDVSDLFDE